jgi:hypothetical protein
METVAKEGRAAWGWKELSISLLVVAFLFGDVFLWARLGMRKLEDPATDAPAQTIVYEKSSGDQVLSATPKISEIDGPSIGAEAATIERVAENRTAAQACFTLPTTDWLFLLLVYIGLLIFNFAYGFAGAARVQWFWEALYTLLALAAWYVWDGCRSNVWFPLYVVKMWLFIFGFYLYFFERKRRILSEEH